MYASNENNGSSFVEAIGQFLKAIFSGSKEDIERISKGGVIGSLSGKYIGTNLTGAEREANEFTTAEREASQQWAEDMYIKYQSPEAQIGSQIKGFQENGINPALMYGGSAPSGGSLPSASAGQSVSPSGVGNLLSTLVQFLRTKNDFSIEKERNEIEERRVRALEELNPSRIEANFASAWRNITSGNLNDIDAQSRSMMNGARISLMFSQLESNQAQAALSRSGISVNDAKIGLLTAQAVNQVIANKYADEYWQANINLQKAQAENNYQAAAKAQSEIEYIDRLAMNADETYKILQNEVRLSGINVDIQEYIKAHQGISYWFGIGTQTMNALSGAVLAGSGASRAASYSRSVTAGLSPSPTVPYGSFGY